ncbi:pentatricopeptide repeat-containing protein [Citrus sinensis]|uniref:Pentatricopeptide repeat-containing protein n=1 Tax=Citrus sinensis TaxID=2711 RepID=A0ACB8KR18_CITSI|nr:pentatricopeptide repeat-containing protein [Citrus sinensis]
MSERNVVSWTAMVNGYSRFGFVDEAFMLFSESIRTGVRGNEKMFVCVMNLCGRRLDFELGRQIHASILKCHCRNLIVDSAILHFYAQFGDFSSAFCAFDGMSERDVVSWTAMITACSQQARGDEAIFMFSRMLSEGFLPNEFTVCSVLKACGEERALKLGRQLHAAIVKKLYKDDVFIRTSLVDMYAKCGEILDSRRVFDEMGNRNTVTWTSIIAGYAREGLGEEAIGLFRVMKRRKIHANNLTIVSILKACGLIGAFQLGKEVHAQIIKNFIQSNEHIGSTLVWFYCKNGEFPVASKVLQQMPLRDVVSWTAIISGYACLGHESEALDFLKDMLEEGVEPNPFTYSSALKACAKLENVSQGMLIHSSVKKTTSLSNVYVGSALINMYAKCGYISEASQVFDNMPERNLFTWKSMIVGYARNGLCQEALKLMYRMQAEGFEVDDYILITVYNACGDIEWNAESSSGKHEVLVTVRKLAFSETIFSPCLLNVTEKVIEIGRLMDSVVLQLCYNGWWETLADGRTEYVNAKNTVFLVRKDCTFEQFMARVYEVLQINPNEYSLSMKTTLRSSNTMYRACSLPMDIFNDEMVNVVLHMASDVVNYGCIPIFVTTYPRVPAENPEPLVESETSFRANESVPDIEEDVLP